MKKITIIVLCFAISVVWISSSIAQQDVNSLRQQAVNIENEVRKIETEMQSIHNILNRPDVQDAMRQDPVYHYNMLNWAREHLNKCSVRREQLVTEHNQIVAYLNSRGHNQFVQQQAPPSGGWSPAQVAPLGGGTVQQPPPIPPVITPPVLSTPGIYVGCFKDQGERDLIGKTEYNDDHMSIEMCRARCSQGGYSFAGVQAGRQCFCGNSYGKYGTANNCDMNCSGNPQEKCGGWWSNGVYRTGR